MECTLNLKQGNTTRSLEKPRKRICRDSGVAVAMLVREMERDRRHFNSIRSFTGWSRGR
jgi:hypothetical protein